MLLAITRVPSATLSDCELTHVARRRIDVRRARAQHAAYRELLGQLGAAVLTLPPLDGLPDATFVEDAAVVLDEVAVATRPGAESRRGEVTSVANALSPHRPVRLITPPGTLDGGDVLRVGRTLYVGRSTRTDKAGRKALKEAVKPFGYKVRKVAMGDRLHLRAAASWIGDGRLLVDPDGVDVDDFPRELERVEVARGEPGAACVVRVGRTLVVDAAFPRTRRVLERHGYRVVATDLGELRKAEAGPSCLSLLLRLNA